MNDFEDDEALARLRAADPAQGAHPDLHRLTERLRGRAPLGSGSQSAPTYAHTSDTAVRVSDPSVRTGRGGLLVAASVAALALAGGGFAVGATLADDGDGQDSLAARDSDPDSPEAPRGTLNAADRVSSDAASSEAATAEGYDEGFGGAGALGPVVPVAGSDLSTQRTSGAVLAPADGPATGAAEALQRYAEALGIEGEVQDYGSGADLVDATDARSLHLNQQGALESLDYANPALDPWCEQTVAEAAREDYKPFGEQGPQEVECAPLGELPSEDEAIAAARQFVAELGIDDSDLAFSIATEQGWFAYQPDGDEAAAEVSVVASDPDRPMEGYREWSFSVTGAGVSYASIYLGELVPLGDYEVISPVEAVERANDARFQSLGVYIPGLLYEDTFEAEWEEPEPLPQVEPGDPIPYPVGEATITGAELHTGVLSLWDGTEFLVPSWHLSDGAGNSWDVLGLTEDSLDFLP